jgi:hypothetical protein
MFRDPGIWIFGVRVYDGDLDRVEAHLRRHGS